jgi:hypothetical protein
MSTAESLAERSEASQSMAAERPHVSCSSSQES